MATPHVTGLIAVLISTFGDTTPKEMIKLLQRFSLKGYVQDDSEWCDQILLRSSITAEIDDLARFLTVNFLAQLPPS
jgi:hypothetical protein